MTNKEVQIKKAEELLKLHHDSQILLLPNAWDVISAKMYEQYGFEAIGTTSAGISATLGYPDGQYMSLEENLSIVKKIADNTQLPVSADIEAGYSTRVEGVIRAAKSALDAGAVGINLEDSTGDDTKPFFEISEQVEKIKAIRDMVHSEKIHLVLNLRIDVYMLGKGSHKEKFAETILRANIYSDAGADSIFVPDTGDFNEKIISELVKEIHAPLNIIAGPNIPPVQKLEEIGVARLSFGPRPMRAMLSLLCKIQTELLEKGTYELMSDERITYKEINRLLERK
ncbi:isocitrate lyase/phosphoenolpyruvate mutase family protein [Bacteroidota bacterium]